MLALPLRFVITPQEPAWTVRQQRETSKTVVKSHDVQICLYKEATSDTHAAINPCASSSPTDPSAILELISSRACTLFTSYPHPSSSSSMTLSERPSEVPSGSNAEFCRCRVCGPSCRQRRRRPRPGRYRGGSTPAGCASGCGYVGRWCVLFAVR